MSDDLSGDLGGDSAPPSPSLSHRRLEERAIRERWPLTSSVRLAILQRLCGIVDPETEEGSQAELRHVIAASRTLIAADRINLDAGRLELAREVIERRYPPDAGDEDDYVVDLCPPPDVEDAPGHPQDGGAAPVLDGDG